jgi:hypothetical protein
MIHITPRAILRTAVWVALLWLNGCGGSKQEPIDPEKALDAICAAASVPVPDSASDDIKQANAATRAACAARRAVAQDGGS